MILWFKFIISSVIIVLAGIVLTKSCDRLSDRLNLGKAWIGIVLLGLVTSLPEAITTIISVKQLQAYDLALGNIFGSNNFNPLLIVLMDLCYRQGSITNEIKPSKPHFLAAGFAIMMTYLVMLEMILPQLSQSTFLPAMTIGQILIIVLYFCGMGFLAKHQSEEVQEVLEEKSPTTDALGPILIQILLSAVFVIAAAMILANTADELATLTGLGRTFVGSIFLALVTSLPEMVVTLSALRLGSVDLALGNIFGSNMTNVFILPTTSLIVFDQPILATVSMSHLITGCTSIVLSLVLILGIRHKQKRTYFYCGLDSWLMLIIFIIGNYGLYCLK